MRLFKDPLIIASLVASLVLGAPAAYGLYRLAHYEDPVVRPPQAHKVTVAQMVNRRLKADRLDADECGCGHEEDDTPVVASIPR